MKAIRGHLSKQFAGWPLDRFHTLNGLHKSCNWLCLELFGSFYIARTVELCFLEFVED